MRANQEETAMCKHVFAVFVILWVMVGQALADEPTSYICTEELSTGIKFMDGAWKITTIKPTTFVLMYGTYSDDEMRWVSMPMLTILRFHYAMIAVKKFAAIN